MRIQRLQKELERNKISCAIISGFSEDPNLEYLLGFPAENTFFLVPKKGNPTILAPKMEIPYLKEKTSHEILAIEPPTGKQIAKIVGSKKTIGINKDAMIVKEFEAIKKRMKNKTYEDISPLLSNIRSIKDKQELSKIKKACSISDKIMQEVMENISIFRTESEVKKYLMKRGMDFGCEMAFDPLVASGKNSSYVHYEDCNKKIKKGFFYVDFGVDYMGYKSDITRTTYIGQPSPREKELYNHLLKVQQDTVRMVQPGIKTSELDNYVREQLGDISAYFTHSLGHGVGIEVHEKPIVSSKAEEKLEEGMVLTIEPGIYFPGKYGMRVEDTVEVTKRGAKILTRAPKLQL